MRVTSNLMFKSGAFAMQVQQQDLAKIQEQTISGTRTNRPSEDPSGTYRHLMVSADLSGVQSLQKTTQFASERLKLADSQMTQMHETLMGAQDLILQMSNSQVGGNPAILKAAAQQPLSWYQEMMHNANTALDEVPLFGGGKQELPFDSKNLMATTVRVQSGGKGKLVPDGTGVIGSVTQGTIPTDLPVSVQIRYLAASNQYQADVNGVKQAPASLDANGKLDLGNGIQFALPANVTPNTGDVYYFEVVPKYQGGQEDRPVRVPSGDLLPGNVTGQELMEGSGRYGKGVNVLASMAALRGALLRADPNEVGLQLTRMQEARAQVSDLQGVTGIRNTQVDAIHGTLQADESELTKVKADNVEVDVFQVMSNLEQASQAMQLLTYSQREVMNNSLIDFIK